MTHAVAYDGEWKTKRMCQLTEDRQHTREYITVLVKLDESWVYVGDNATESKLVEFQDRKEAQRFARSWYPHLLTKE